MIAGADGNFYGTTASGGASGNGTVFRVTPAGALATLVEFTGNGGANRGSYAEAALALGTDGNFYGTTTMGGAAGYGTIFRMSPGGLLTTLVEFTNGGARHGSYPSATLTLGADGNFYGTTESGGAGNAGTIFRVTPAGALSTLLDFSGTGGANRGANPQAALTLGANGYFYGASDLGTVFRLRFKPDGSPTQLLSVGIGPNGGTRVRWQASSGQVSRVEYSDDPTGVWQAVAGTVTADSSGQVEYLDTTQPTTGRRFYRLVTPF